MDYPIVAPGVEYLIEQQGFKVEKSICTAFIVDGDGKQVSDRYHEFRFLQTPKGRMLIGIAGSGSYLLDEAFQQLCGYHEYRFLHTRRGKILTGKSGAITEVLSKDFLPVFGYHEIIPDGDTLICKLGTAESRVEILDDWLF